ncbi:metallophosphoesterase [Candidatus Izemoplasma sp. B36]|uniref:metallophosphoesterase n=1 Tax=Candidatus Izemoplasma sp. B36 TaxID=3242468 RepID=UPI003556188F
MLIYFILSDIHSQYDLLIKALDKAGFDMENENHILVIVGDILDRGKQGDKLIRFIEKLITLDRILAVVGNHDDFLIEILKGNINLKTIKWNIKHNGFIETLKLGCLDQEEIKINKESILKIKENLVKKYPIFTSWIVKNPLFIIFNKHVIVHGFLDFSLDNWKKTSRHYAIWERGYDKKVPDSFPKKLIIGHTPNYYINKSNEIIYDGKKIMIDGGAASQKQINVLRLNDEEF